MPIAGLEDLQSRICRKSNPSPRAAQAYFFSCTTQFSFQYDKQTFRPVHVVVNASDDINELMDSVLTFASKVVNDLGQDMFKRQLCIPIVMPVLLGSYVVLAFDDDYPRACRSLKKLADLAETSQLPILASLFSSASEGISKYDLFLNSLTNFVKYVSDGGSNNEMRHGLEAISVATIAKCSLYRMLTLISRIEAVRFIDDSLGTFLSNTVECIFNIVLYDNCLTKNLSSCGDNAQRSKSLLYELSGTAAALAFAGHLIEQITNQRQSVNFEELFPKKAVFSKVVTAFVSKLQTRNPAVVGIDSHSLSLLWALHKIFGTTRQPSFLQQCFVLSVGWITSATNEGNVEEISRRCRFPFISKILRDMFSGVDKSSSAKMWFLAVEQLGTSNLTTLFQLWRIYLDHWSIESQDDENCAPDQANSSKFTNRFTLSRAVLFSSKVVVAPSDRIMFMFKELSAFASAGSLSQFANEMKVILRLLAEATSDNKIERFVVTMKSAELNLACWQNEYNDINVDDVIKSCDFDLESTPIVWLIGAQGWLLSFMKIWYERQSPKPDDILISPTTQSDLLKTYGIVVPDAANRPNCNCFDHAIVSPKMAAEHADTVVWLQLLHKASDMLIAVKSLKACEETSGVSKAVSEIVVLDAINALYTCSALSLLMREHVRALSCFLRLKSWVEELKIGGDGWSRRLDLLLLQIRIYFLDTGLESAYLGDSSCESLAAALKSVPESLSLRMRLFCATTTCTSSSETSSILVDCPAHYKSLAKCTPMCRWLLSSPLCTSFWASTQALTETFAAFDRSKPIRAKHFASGGSRCCFGDTVLRFADLLDALYFASDVALVAGVFRDAARAAYEGLRYAIRFASTKWIYAFQLQMLESLKFQDKIQHASHYKLLTEASIPDKLVHALLSSDDADDLMLAGRLSMKYKIWHELHSRLTSASTVDESALSSTADWLKMTLADISKRVKVALNSTAMVKDLCSVASPLADVRFAAWLHYFDFATRFPGNDLELLPSAAFGAQSTDESASIATVLSRINISIPALPVPLNFTGTDNGVKSPEQNGKALHDEDLSKVFAPRKPSYEALSLANLSLRQQQQQQELSPVATGGRSGRSTRAATAASLAAVPSKSKPLLSKASGRTHQNESVLQSSASSSIPPQLAVKFDESSLQVARYFPLAPVYSELCRLRAIRSFTTGASPMITAYWLHEANTVCFRHMLRAVFAVQRVAIESSRIVTQQVSSEMSQAELRHLKDVRLLTRFPPVYEDFVESVKEIPTQWAVVSLSILPPGTTTSSNSEKNPTPRMAAICVWRARHRRDQPDVKFFDASNLLMLLMRFEQLMLDNEESLRLKTRKEFWKCRSEIDKRMSDLMDDADDFVKSFILTPDLVAESKRRHHQQQSSSAANSSDAFIDDVEFDDDAGGDGSTDPSSRNCEVSGSRPVVILQLDAWTTPFTWEDVPSLRNFAVTRSLTLPFLVHQLKTALATTNGCRLVGNHQLVRWPLHSISYVLDPENNLAKTRATFEPIVTTRMPAWSGFVGRFPSARELLDQLRKTQMFVFIGHGSGLHSTSFRDLGDQKTILSAGSSDSSNSASGGTAGFSLKMSAIGVLMGCSSMRLVDFRRRDLHNSALFFPLAQSPAVFGNLFNVTDIDIDRFLMLFLDSALTCRWRNGFVGNKDHPSPPVISDDELKSSPRTVSLLAALTKARSGCKLRFLNGSAPVCYGLPLALARDDDVIS